jgi:hypothetical protein
LLRYIGHIHTSLFGFEKQVIFSENDETPKICTHGSMLTLFSHFWPRPITRFVSVGSGTSDSNCFYLVWALFGTAIKTYLHHPRLKAAVNIILSLFLVYAALGLAGIL